MHRRKFIRNSSLGLTLLLLGKMGPLTALSGEVYQIKMLNHNTGIFIEKGGTILFQLNKAGIILVDSQFTDSATHLLEELKKRTTLSVNILVNTHHHTDHTSGNIIFQKYTKHILAHVNSKINQEYKAKRDHTESMQAYPNQTYTNHIQRKIGNETLRLDYLGAGHTNGDSLVYLKKAGVVHLGDLVFNKKHPYIDKPSGASITNWITILEKIPHIYPANTVFICGHAAKGHSVIITEEDIFSFRDYLKNLLKFTSEQIANGISRLELLENTFIPGSPEWQDGEASRGLDAAYTELTAHFK